jgi:ribosomal protein S27AE
VDDERVIATTLPHSDFGDPDCCGCLNGIAYGGQAVIVCNECLAEVQTVPVAELEQTLHEMELSLDVATAECPHCGAIYIAPGFSELLAFVCDQCGHGVTVADEN